VTYDMALSMAGIGLQGNVKGRAEGLSAEVPRIDATFDLKAKNIAPIAALAGLPADGAKELGAVALAGKAASGADDLTYDVTLGLAGIAGNGALKGRVTGLKGEPQIDTILDLKADQPAPLLRMAGLAGPKAKAVGPLGVSGTLKGGMNDMVLDLDLAALGGTAKLAMSARNRTRSPDLAAADHPEFSNLAKLADLPSSGEAAGPLKLRAKVAGSTARASVSGLDAAWGESRIQGEADYDATGAKPMVRAALAGGLVDVRPFMAPPPKAKKNAAAGAPWSEEPLDLGALNAQDADIDFTAQSLLTADQRIDDLVAKISIRDGLMTMNTLSGRIYGGAFDLAGTQVNQGHAGPRQGALQADPDERVAGGGIAGNQVEGRSPSTFAANGAGAWRRISWRSCAARATSAAPSVVIGKIEQTVGSTRSASSASRSSRCKVSPIR
jgi:hypothetical protein